MKLLKIIVPLFVFTILTVSCSGGTELVSLQSELTQVQEEMASVQSELDLKISENANLEDNTKEISKSFEKTKTELESAKQKAEKAESALESYKVEVAPYLLLSKAEAEAKALEIEASQIALKAAEEEAKRVAAEEAAVKKAAEKEAQKKAAEEAAAQKAAELAKGYETGITFDQLARTPNDYKGKKVKFRGTIIQVIEGVSSSQYRFAVNDDYDKIMLLTIPNAQINNNRILEDDTITIFGISKGLITYESTMGGDITIPAIGVDKFE